MIDRALILLLLSGCATFQPATEPIEIFAKDGERAMFVECRRTPTNCYKAAQQQCRGPYIPLEDNRRSSIIADAYGADTIHRFELTFRCKQNPT